MGKRKSASWMYMSRLAAQKEWAFMKVRPESSMCALYADSDYRREERGYLRPVAS